MPAHRNSEKDPPQTYVNPGEYLTSLWEVDHSIHEDKGHASTLNRVPFHYCFGRRVRSL